LVTTTLAQLHGQLLGSNLGYKGMPRNKVHRSDRIQYYRGAAEFWRAAIRLQQQRCLTDQKESVAVRADLNFYVVAVQRLREVARMAREKLQIQAAADALDQFDQKWSRFKELRNVEEHVLGPTMNQPEGIWYFQKFAADLQNETKLLALTGLTRQEFADLVPVFQASFETVLREQTLEGLERIGRGYTTYHNSALPTAEDKLLFILVYLKQAPTQTLHGQLFGMSQSNANKWIHLLHRVLNHALAMQECLPTCTARIGDTADPAPDDPPFFS
jgi:hypothetical protein